jgi:hypothetical protein
MLEEIAKAVVPIAREQGCFKILADLREATIALSILEAYELPKMFAEIMSASGLSVHKFKRADLLPDDWQWSQFYETVSKNRIQNVTLFHDMEKAQKWLLEN